MRVQIAPFGVLLRGAFCRGLPLHTRAGGAALGRPGEAGQSAGRAVESAAQSRLAAQAAPAGTLMPDGAFQL